MINKWTPTFDTQIFGLKHAPQFISTLTINSESYMGAISPTKRAAEKSASDQFLRKYKNISSNDKPEAATGMDLAITSLKTPKITSPINLPTLENLILESPKLAEINYFKESVQKAIKIEDTILFLDVENIPVFDFESFSGLEIYIVHSKNHVLKNEYTSTKNKYTIVCVPCAMPDSADIGIISLCSRISFERSKQNLHIYILSKDKFASTLEILAEKKFFGNHQIQSFPSCEKLNIKLKTRAS